MKVRNSLRSLKHTTRSFPEHASVATPASFDAAASPAVCGECDTLRPLPPLPLPLML